MPTKSYSEGRRYYYGESLEKYEERFLVCRDIGHHWIPAPHWDVTYRGDIIIEYRRTSICENCDGQRTQFYDKEMRPAKGTYYHHSNGYLMGKEVEVKISSRESRLEQLRRHGLDIAQPRRVGKRRRLRAV